MLTSANSLIFNSLLFYCELYSPGSRMTAVEGWESEEKVGHTHRLLHREIILYWNVLLYDIQAIVGVDVVTNHPAV